MLLGNTKKHNDNIDLNRKIIRAARAARIIIGVRAGEGDEGAAGPPVLKIFGQNAYDSAKST